MISKERANQIYMECLKYNSMQVDSHNIDNYSLEELQETIKCDSATYLHFPFQYIEQEIEKRINELKEIENRKSCQIIIR